MSTELKAVSIHCAVGAAGTKARARDGMAVLRALACSGGIKLNVQSWCCHRQHMTDDIVGKGAAKKAVMVSRMMSAHRSVQSR